MFQVFSPRSLIVGLCALTSMNYASGQSTVPAPTNLQLERTVKLTEAFNATTTTVPPSLATALASGAMEIREQINYNGTMLAEAMFAVTPGSPSPTVLNTLPAQSLITTTQIAVDRVYVATLPSAAMLFTGTIVSNQPASPFGNLTGAPASLSFAYAGDKSAKFTGIVTTAAGIVTSYSATGVGNINYPPVTPPVGPGTGPQIVITPPTQTAFMKFLTLDASATKDAQNLPMTFVWRSVNKSVAIAYPNNAVVSVQLTEGAGDYIFEVTVTDTAGNIAKATTTISYVGR